MKKLTLILSLLAFLSGCGTTDAPHSTIIGCDDVPPVDTSTPDVVVMDAALDTVDANTAPDVGQSPDVAPDQGVDSSVPHAPYTLSIRVHLPPEQANARMVNVAQFTPTGLVISYMGAPMTPAFIAGEYEPVLTEINNVEDASILLSINWIYEGATKNSLSSLLTWDSMRLRFIHQGRVEVRDQYGRVWVGIPTPIKRFEYLILRFVPGPCTSDFRMRSDDLCIR